MVVTGRGFTTTTQPILCRFGDIPITATAPASSTTGSLSGGDGSAIAVGYNNLLHPMTTVATVVNDATLLCVAPPAAKIGDVSLVILVNGLALALVPTTTPSTPSTPITTSSTSTTPSQGLVFRYVPPPVISSLLPSAGPLAGDPPSHCLYITLLVCITTCFLFIRGTNNLLNS